ncbi:hypothetical protein KP509_37G019700 [Ceratopteris richardii]|uniref:Uncharacterized protein n=1 Tax=Ceratopteris richardii TaxID=49495 RepID=A0A8T2Q6N7_CERRI|nr:hypothetical protein KP509_37G019700 [Ceratopteris richardii]
MGCAEFVEVVLAIIFPPLGVFLRYGCRLEFWICVLLTILGYLPGIVYALYVILCDERFQLQPPPRYYAPTAPLV